MGGTVQGEICRQATPAEHHRLGLRTALSPLPPLPGASAAMEGGGRRCNHGTIADGECQGRQRRTDPVLPVPEEVAGGNGGIVGQSYGGEQRHAGAHRCSRLVQDNMVLAPVASTAQGVLLYEDEQRHGVEGRPAGAGAVRFGVLGGVGQHAAQRTEQTEGGDDHAQHQRAWCL